MAFSQGFESDDPVSAMNMTPLIDVLLVLLIMFVVTIPIATHSMDFDVVGDDFDRRVIDVTSNKLVVTADDDLLWNRERITRAQLTGLLRATTRMTPEPELQFEPEAQASYQTSAEVMRLIKVSGVTRFGFVGNERYRQFAAGD